MKTLTAESVLTIENILLTPYTENLREWRNSPDVRRNMIDDTVIGEDEHGRYIASLRARDDRRVFVVEDGGAPLIVLNMSVDEVEGLVNLGWHGVNRAEVAPLYSIYAFYASYDWLFKAHPGCSARDVVLASNTSVCNFIAKCGMDVGEPREVRLRSGRRALARDTYCTSEMWFEGSGKMRPLYERVLSKAAYAQTEIVW